MIRILIGFPALSRENRGMAKPGSRQVDWDVPKTERRRQRRALQNQSSPDLSGPIELVSASRKPVGEILGHFFGVCHIDNAAYYKPRQPIRIHAPCQIVTRRN